MAAQHVLAPRSSKQWVDSPLQELRQRNATLRKPRQRNAAESAMVQDRWQTQLNAHRAVQRAHRFFVAAARQAVDCASAAVATVCELFIDQTDVLDA